jgi:hypothetical protein
MEIIEDNLPVDVAQLGEPRIYGVFFFPFLLLFLLCLICCWIHR